MKASHCVLIGVATITVFLYQEIHSSSANENSSGTRNAKHYYYYHHDNIPECQQCSCGVSNLNMSSRPDEKRIVGGTQVTPNAYPWMVLITGNNTPACGGSIISDQYVVTAAHCTSLRYRQEELKVVVGQQNYCTPDNKIAIFSIEKMIIHPLFNDTDFSYDIMLLKLSMRILFNDIVRPICLPFWVLTKVNDLDIPETEATILGWGVTAFNSLNRSCELQEATVNVIPRKKCLMNSHYTLQLLPDTLICAGVSDGSKDSCQGDSGGPLQIKREDDRYELLGIISTGVSCGHKNYPGIYTNVPLFTAWIVANTEDSMYCKN